MTQQQFDQLTIADFADYQIVWPTTTQSAERRLFSAIVSVPERIYAPIGWLFAGEQMIAQLQGLNLTTFATVDCPFQLYRRIGTAIPISFEAISPIALPTHISKHAIFTSAMPGLTTLFHTFFRCVKPRFVRIYDAKLAQTLSDIVQRFLAEEQQFIAKNHTQLKLVPFYQAEFRL
ncbi:hypothetical protein IQ266_04505 [filamentous cyanobacterium LEGE 11480]|uniref:Uncharacterized protein n=1 Tax=Romeriopsis navalis LEGE 11480 TaxID=2777977 RepID=A0A928VJY3_9CYAN|nr:hypothetical protein [Romeriopsis navalis]MBE9029022.1 hypothetical protein [Romeriopsis navalis LEGE 11480]